MGQSAEELTNDIQRTRTDLGETLDAIGDRMSPGRMMERRKNRMTNGMRAVRNRVMGTVEDFGFAVSETGHAAGSRAGEMADDAVEKVRSMPDTVRQQSQGNPLMAGAIAFGFGFILASAFPASRTERRAASQLMEKAEPIKQELTEAASEIAQDMREPAREAMERVKEAASEGAQTVAGSAKAAMHETTDDAREATDRVRGE
jgi:ElaB/YqjD/DUF883 family membrane-anchored ribosome-binding protein